MGLNLGGLLGSVGSIAQTISPLFGGTSFSGIGTLGTVASNIGTALSVRPPIPLPGPSVPAPRMPPPVQRIPRRGNGGGRTMPLPIPFPFNGGDTARLICTSIRQSIFAATGRKIKTSKLRSMVKTVGVEAAAEAVGLSSGELAQLLLTCPRRKRPLIKRTDIRACRRVANAMDNLQRLVSRTMRGVRTSKSRRSAPCRTCRQNPCKC